MTPRYDQNQEQKLNDIREFIEQSESTDLPYPKSLDRKTQDDHIAYCGVDCEACPDLSAGKCPGCRKTDWAPGDECMPVACCRGRGIAFCGECGDFPCPDMRAFYEESDSHREAHARMLALGGR